MAKIKLLASTVTFDADAMSSFEELVPEQQLAEELDVVDRTVREWRERGTGPDFIRIGRSVFYRRSAIMAWISRRTVRLRAGPAAQASSNAVTA